MQCHGRRVQYSSNSEQTSAVPKPPLASKPSLSRPQTSRRYAERSSTAMRGTDDDENYLNGLQRRSQYQCRESNNLNIKNLLEFLSFKKDIVRRPLSERSSNSSVIAPQPDPGRDKSSPRVEDVQKHATGADSKTSRASRPPKVTGKSWIVVDGESGAMMGGKSEVKIRT